MLSGKIFAGMRRLRQSLGLTEQRCTACHAPHTPSSMPLHTPADALCLCATCRQHIALRKTLCPSCGAIVQELSPIAVCGTCLVQPPPWSRLHVLGLYHDVLRKLLLRVKYRGDRSLAVALGTLLAQRIQEHGFTADTLVPMPLHPHRLRQRGFNQCIELARPLAATLGTPHEQRWAQRIVATPSQTGLRKNVCAS